MRLLLDESVPRRFRRALPAHIVKTAVEMGWGEERQAVGAGMLPRDPTGRAGTHRGLAEEESWN